jgi:hypothetical protein
MASMTASLSERVALNNTFFIKAQRTNGNRISGYVWHWEIGVLGKYGGERGTILFRR